MVLECLEIEEPCPLDNIKISVRTPDGKEVTEVISKSKKKNLKVKVEIERIRVLVVDYVKQSFQTAQSE